MAANYQAGPILTVSHMKQHFKVNSGFTVKAVDDVSFEIYPGETYGLVGESGSGKRRSDAALSVSMTQRGGRSPLRGRISPGT